MVTTPGEIYVGSPIHILCTGLGTPSPSVNYTQNGIIRVGERPESGLIYSHAVPQNSGTYQCIIYNSAGTFRTQEFPLLVIRK